MIRFEVKNNLEKRIPEEATEVKEKQSVSEEHKQPQYKKKFQLNDETFYVTLDEYVKFFRNT